MTLTLLKSGSGALYATSVAKVLKIDKPNVNAITIANDLNIDVQFGRFNKYAEKVASILHPKKSLILVNMEMPRCLINFSIARNIGKYLMSDDDSVTLIEHDRYYDTNNEFEYECTTFALKLLAGPNTLSYFGDIDTIIKVIEHRQDLLLEIANCHNVPPRAMKLAIEFAKYNHD